MLLICRHTIYFVSGLDKCQKVWYNVLVNEERWGLYGKRFREDKDLEQK
jgi:hypothetical protein